LNVLIACECSGTVRNAFRALGHEAWSCDLLPSEDMTYHIEGDCLKAIAAGRPTDGQPWDLLIAHPPCIYLTVTANKWLKDQPPRKSGALVGAERRAAQQDAAKFFMAIAESNVPRIAIENPVGYMSTYWRKPDQIIQPFQFGHPEPKKTCLWLKNLPKLVPTKIVEPEYSVTRSGKRIPTWYHSPSPSPDRQKKRSVTFQGIAGAMADQWGNAAKTIQGELL